MLPLFLHTTSSLLMPQDTIQRPHLLSLVLLASLFTLTQCGKDNSSPTTTAPITTAPTSYSLRTTLERGTSTTQASATSGFTSCHPRYSMRPQGGPCDSSYPGNNYLQFETSRTFINGTYTDNTTRTLPAKGTTMYLYARFSFGTSFNPVTPSDKITVELLDDKNQTLQTIQFTGAEAMTGNFGTGYGNTPPDRNGNSAGDDPTKFVTITLP